MALEKLSPTTPEKALHSYRTALPLLTVAQAEISAVLPSTVLSSSTSSGGGKVDFPSFTRFREVWRWVERLIWRAIVLTSRTCNVNNEEDTLWTWLSHYTACSVHWPATFRSRHRSVISVLHLHALVLRAKSSPAPASPLTPSLSYSALPLPPPSPYLAPPQPLPPQEQPRRPPLWVQTARSVVQEYRAILTVSTRFPRAGERNIKVENFVDLCVAVWEASGEVGDHAGWVIDVRP